jgi:tRNA (cytidine/uridine-2'-O-)-methyltransferase
MPSPSRSSAVLAGSAAVSPMRSAVAWRKYHAVMFHLILFEPEIPPNTGNLIRLCANTGSQLHLIEPLGFRLEDRDLRRAGLDYHEWSTLKVHAGWDCCRKSLGAARVFASSTRNSLRHDAVRYQPGDAFLLGPESRGLPDWLLERFAPEHRLRIPMRPGQRSLNLANSGAVLIYEAWRQLGFAGGV